MLKKLVAILLLALSIQGEAVICRTLDFGKVDPSSLPSYSDVNWEAIKDDYCPFNIAVELEPYFYYLKKYFDLDVAVETGTWQGETTKFLGFLFDEVHTIEVDVDTFNSTLVKLRPYRNIDMHYGDSGILLHSLLPTLKDKRVLFYLDAHWFDNWPLLQELEEIGRTHRDNCIVVIDDFKVPGRPDIPYDAYNPHECSYEYIKATLNQVFSDYVYYYVIPKDVNSRAKFVGIPKSWMTHW